MKENMKINPYEWVYSKVPNSIFFSVFHLPKLFLKVVGCIWMDDLEWWERCRGFFFYTCLLISEYEAWNVCYHTICAPVTSDVGKRLRRKTSSVAKWNDGLRKGRESLVQVLWGGCKIAINRKQKLKLDTGKEKRMNLSNKEIGSFWWYSAELLERDL